MWTVRQQQLIWELIMTTEHRCLKSGEIILILGREHETAPARIMKPAYYWLHEPLTISALADSGQMMTNVSFDTSWKKTKM